MGEKEPLEERSGCLIEFYIQLESTPTKSIHLKENSIIMSLVLSAVKELL